MDIKEPTEQELRDFLMRKFFEDKLKPENSANYAEMKQHMKKNKQNLMRVTAEILFKYLAQKGVSRKCLGCGSEKLSVPQMMHIKLEGIPENFGQLPEVEREMILDSVRIMYVRYVSFEGEDDPMGLLNSYYTVHCNNCGNLTLYRAMTVLDWLNSLEDKSGGADEKQ